MKLSVAGLLVLLVTAVLTGGSSAAHRSALPATEHGGAAWVAPDDIDGMPHNPLPHLLRTTAAAKALKKTGFNCISACSDYEEAINQYFTDVAADSGKTTNVYSVAGQYSPIQYSSTFSADTNVALDGNPYPTAKACHDGYDTYCVTDAQLQAQIGKVIAANGWPTNSPTSLYFIFTPANVGVCIAPGNRTGNACTTNAFCAYHNNSPTFIYAVEPDDAAVKAGGCVTREAAPAGSYADDTINTISHEQNEAISDPLGTAWYADDADSGEMADLCAWDFGPQAAEPNQVINGHNYLLQLEYSNEDGGCVPYLGGPVTAADPLDGSGPVVSHSGSVMSTHTVYTIYWVPAKPANGKPPKVTGTSKVGKKLTATRGTWSYAPTSYTYRWLRCSPAGTSCKGIALAHGSTYTQVKADTGHRLEVQVTATNMAGSIRATSAVGNSVKR